MSPRIRCLFLLSLRHHFCCWSFTVQNTFRHFLHNITRLLRSQTHTNTSLHVMLTFGQLPLYTVCIGLPTFIYTNNLSHGITTTKYTQTYIHYEICIYSQVHEMICCVGKLNHIRFGFWCLCQVTRWILHVIGLSIYSANWCVQSISMNVKNTHTLIQFQRTIIWWYHS